MEREREERGHWFDSFIDEWNLGVGSMRAERGESVGLEL